ncbi:hypothetical protein COU77_01505 [Candidatus Peregrinibacteria bacterium CG10_big_fil_rev_8_21_14_0_10_49_16]|nr:MAG: hypothetical protein COW95_01815 [Candidatus Peregrinibacteria bacterium CG22_combo_CG10-13_8_21_14_all_49_11]PIR52178.1 MAG: hypothetical protein COU77_01505 [Candidatus Peregrinibacteria bacterium CG10_big_fil_rev_8_21_14_0_10_49_16]
MARQTYTTNKRLYFSLIFVLLIVITVVLGQHIPLTGSLFTFGERLQKHIERLQKRIINVTPEFAQQHAAPSVAFGLTVYPVNRVPNWGAMRTPAEWERSFVSMQPGDFVPVPAYDLDTLTIPLQRLARSPITPDRYPALTAKLYYSTRFFGAYDLDSGEFEAPHPGIDLKLAPGTPIGAIAGGRVHLVGRDNRLGTLVIIEHHSPEGIVFSIYGHLADTIVFEGDMVQPRETIGIVGMTGATTAPHLHLQIDRDRGVRPHVPYAPNMLPKKQDALRYTVHPIEFIETFGKTTL